MKYIHSTGMLFITQRCMYALTKAKDSLTGDLFCTRSHVSPHCSSFSERGELSCAGPTSANRPVATPDTPDPLRHLLGSCQSAERKMNNRNEEQRRDQARKGCKS